MNRLPRRWSRLKPPLRGRAATRQYRGEFAPVTSVRRPLQPYSSGGFLPVQSLPLTEKIAPPASPSESSEPPTALLSQSSPKGDLYAKLVELYKSSGRLLRDLDQPWQWLVVFAIVVTSLLLLNRLL